ncbi:type I-E CRISPR-associated endoribonuclease Cas2e [Aerococcaceae bacterium NML201209]|nr:type I-E CRISPR-associated endoribonuclease Cas2e [Aerococcaceae bacterium NML201209]MCW6664930.1 type I-E CRISPR-associated endoribonuclease Cas2e [Aerococcaceae bacterium NML191219]
MPFTIITLKKVPSSLRGDLTKWMQEIATGVYVGNFNTKVREQLWSRVVENVEEGEATLSFACRNELGYQFDTVNTKRSFVDSDGIPLVIIPNVIEKHSENSTLELGFSKAAKLRKSKQFSRPKNSASPNYVVIDIETDGLDKNRNSIIELGAIKCEQGELKWFNALVNIDRTLPKEITKITGITQELLKEEGKPMSIALKEFLEFIGNDLLVGYNIEFDISFINSELKRQGFERLNNPRMDLLKYVKQENLFLENYKLQTILKEYGIERNVSHRATEDARLIFELSLKVNKFQRSVRNRY